MDKVIEKWDEILQTVKRDYNISDVAFNTWLKPLEVYDVTDNVITILVPSEQVVLINLLNKKYKLLLQVTICELTGISECDVKFISPDEAPQKDVPSYDNAAPAMSDIERRCEDAHLNPKYIFDTFIVGNNNKFAQAAALAVAESPGDTYNPLFIYGGAGLGKTHLMHSIAHYIIEHDENSKVLYVTSEEFTNELIETIRNGNNSAMSKFREKYRNIDVLLVDDIQFIIGKESTQEEFFHTFNTLVENGKQIVLTSDRPPKEIQSLTERLCGRFESGLLADIQPPEFETRCAIIKNKAQLLNFQISNDVVDFIAEKIKSNIRQLEGTTKKLYAMCKITGHNPTTALAQKVIKDVIDNEVPPTSVTVNRIIEEVSRTEGVSEEDIKSSKQKANISHARKMCMYIIREATTLTYEMIGKEFKKNYSTVIYSIKEMEKEIQNDSKMQRKVSDIINNIKTE